MGLNAQQCYYPYTIILHVQVRELLKVNDENGVRLLAIITDQFVSDPKLAIWKAQETPMTDKCRYLWDQLGNFITLYF